VVVDQQDPDHAAAPVTYFGMSARTRRSPNPGHRHP
jgi:hypothetical protein